MFRMFGLGGSRQKNEGSKPESFCESEFHKEAWSWLKPTPIAPDSNGLGEPTTEAGMLIAGGLGMLEPFGRR